ncbi:MAG TPA: hypothetical protein VFZ97_11565 [Acidimicrobiales bacterium]
MRSVRTYRRGIPAYLAAFAAASTIVGTSLLVQPTSAAFADGGVPAPTITAPASSATPTVPVSGTASTGASVGVLDGGVLVGTATADSETGNWSTVLNLLQGNHSLTAEQTVSGQTGPASAPPVNVNVTSNQVATNGSFEQPVIGHGFPGETFNGNWSNFSTGIPDWAATNGCGIELQTQATVGVTPFDGNQYAELNSNCVSGITQTVATVPGTQYIFKFAYQARPNTSPADNTMAVQWNGSYLVGSAQPGSGLQGGTGWTVAQYAVTATATTAAIEFDSTENPSLGFPDNSLGDFVDGVSLTPAAAQDSNTSWLTAKYLGTPGQVGASQSLNFQGEALWYDFSVTPGEQLQVSLSNVAGDYNIAVFSDISQAFNALNNSTPNLAALGAEAPGSAASPSAFSPSAFSPSAFSPSAFSPSAFSPSAFSPSAFSPSAFSPSAFSPSAFSPSAFSAAYSSAQLDSLLAVSTAPGAVDKSVTVNTWNNTGNFYVRITGNNGAFVPFSPYTLTVTNLGGPCGGGLSSFSGDPTISGAGGPSYSTVIIADSTLMPNVGQTYTGGNPLYTPLQQLALATGGVVVDVGKSQMVNDLQAQAAANPGCPYAPDLEAAAIQNIINSYRVTPTNLKNVVIVGDDDVIPFFRYPDNAGLAGESNYQPPLLSTSSPEAALVNNYYVSDDQYGAANQLTIQGVTVPLSTAAVGRLVQTPADILATVNNYLGGARTISPTSSLSVGYDFMGPPATQVASAFQSGIGGTNNSTLINNGWTASNLQSALFGSHHDLAFLAAHFSANNLLAADQATTMTTNQFATLVGTTLRNSLVLGAGCHAGYNIDPADAIPGVTDPLAWPQTFAQAGSTLIAGSGYQYGDTNYVAYSDQLYVDIAQQLGYQPSSGPGPVPVGLAMLAAKQKYLAGVVHLGGIEEKALLETTLYGLPMIGVQEPHQAPAPGGSASVATASPVDPNPPNPPNPANLLGLQQANIDFSGFSLSPTTVTPPGSNTSFTYDSGAQGVTAAPGGPVLPVQTYNVNVTNETLRGVGFVSGNYTDTTGTNPLTGDPATETGNPQVVPFGSPVFFPQTTWNPNYFGTLLNGGDTELALTPVQYMSDSNGASTDTMRTFSDEGLRLFYSNNTQKYGANTPALAAPPTVSNVTGSISGNTVTFSANVTGDLSAGIQDVWVTYTGLPGDPNHGKWQSLDLTQNASDSTLWTAQMSFPNPSGIVFMVQAVNGVGEVSMDNNNGYYFTPGVTVGAVVQNLTPHTLALSGGTSGTFLSSATVSATLSPGLTNAPITFDLGPSSVTAPTNSSGVATATIPLIEPPGTYTLTASFAGDASDQPAAAHESFQISKAATSLTLSPPTGQISFGVNSGAKATLTSGGTPLAQKAVYFVISQSGTPIGASVGITNSKGVAQAGIINFVPGTGAGGYSLTAYFGSSTTPLPGGTYNATDPDYLASTSSAASVNVTAFTQVISGTRSGSLTINSGQLVLITGHVTSSVTVNSGGGLEVYGGSISGAVSSNGAVVFILCNATLGSSLSVNGSTGFVFIGGGMGTGCAPSSVGGTTTLSKNTDGVEIANTSVNGSLTVSNNTGPTSSNSGLPAEPEVAGDSIAGSLSCDKNQPGVTNANQPNTASSKSGQCAAL